MSNAPPTVLSYEQLLHFADHGWLILKGVLDEGQCKRYRQALDRSVTRHHVEHMNDSATITWAENMFMHEGIYLDWFKTPGVIDANRQLLGVRPRFLAAVANITAPHPDRQTRREELQTADTWGWHRDFRPKYGLFQSDDDPSLVNAMMVGNITYLTPVSAGNGATAVLDGSHRLEGDYRSLKSQCSVVHAEAPAGSVLLFSESLVHTAVPIVSEMTRYAFLIHFTTSWTANWPGFEVPSGFADGLNDEELRLLFTPATLADREAQYPETSAPTPTR